MHFGRLFIVVIILCMFSKAGGATIFGVEKGDFSTSSFFGPGDAEFALGNIEIRNISFVSPTSMLVPYVSNNIHAGTFCVNHKNSEKSQNDSVSICEFTVGGKTYMPTIPHHAPLGGQVIATFADNGDLIIAMDLSLTDGDGESFLIPFYGTTGELLVPLSSKNLGKKKIVVEYVGSLLAGEKISGNIGDSDKDGMLDGVFVSVGHFPKTYKRAPGASYAIKRSFITNIPYKGLLVGKLPVAKSHYDSNASPMFEVTPPTNSSR